MMLRWIDSKEVTSHDVAELPASSGLIFRSGVTRPRRC
jgi:hypothetical protein